MSGSMQAYPRWLRGLLLAPGLLALAVTFILPLIWLGRISVLPRRGDGVALPGFTLQAYQHVLGDGFYWWVLWKTVWLGVLTAALAVPMAFPIALFLARTTTRWRGVLAALAIAPLLTSTVIRTYGWMVILGRHGMINDMLLWSGLLATPVRLDNGTLATVIALTEILMPYAIISILSNLGRLNMEIEQAAALLGATPVQVFRRVVLPLVLPGLMTAALLVFVLAISSLVTPQLMGGGRVFVLATEIFNETTVTLNWQVAGALSILLLLLFGGVISVYQRILSRMEERF